MTEDEKKEFEEFLQWKAEKAKQAEQNKSAEQESPAEASDEVDNTPTQQVETPPKGTASSNDVEKDSSNTGFIITAAVIGIIVLFSLLTCLSNKNKTVQPAEPELNLVAVDSDSIAVVDEVDNYVSETTKAVWDFNIEKDEMTDTKNIWATITSDNYITQDFPYEGRTRATIIVRYMKKYGYDVLIQISQGQMNGREYYSTNYVTARFDDGNPKKYYFNESADGDSKVVFLRNHSEFIKNCKKAKDIKIDLPLYQGGRPVFTFHVDEPLVWPEG